MKFTVLLVDPHGPHIYGSTVIEDEYLSMYDVVAAAIALVKNIFEVDEVQWEWGQKLTCTLGGASPYKAEFKYKTVEYFEV